MMRRILILLSAIAGFAGPAFGAGQAFIGLHDEGSNGWGRDIALREIFEDKLGFNSVNLNNDATPNEMAIRIEEFLSRPGEAVDRRIVWVNRLSESPDNPCPRNSSFAIQPSVPTLIFGPECLAEYLEPKLGGLHVKLRDLPLSKPETVSDRWSKTPPLVFIALPSDSERIIAKANELVLAILEEATSGYVSPSSILQRLRYELIHDGSNYTPSIDAFPATSAWSRRFLTPDVDLSTFKPRFISAAILEGGLRWSKKNSFGLYAKPLNRLPPSVWLASDTPVTVIRRSRDGDMGFVKTGDNLFGWIKLDVLD
ncbi:MAG: hypothetical protein CMF71_09555 [Magnetovibrio sp.]|nr:hypothetical protein [Magnetovibrio sp.]